jgi:hypothetical protein
MTTHQKIKAQARDGAKTAPKADPEIAERAKTDAEKTSGRQPAQPIYKTQTEDIAGKNVHHDKDKVISEFDDPDAHKVR